jgi:hypothetical protein
LSLVRAKEPFNVKLTNGSDKPHSSDLPSPFSLFLFLFQPQPQPPLFLKPQSDNNTHLSLLGLTTVNWGT